MSQTTLEIIHSHDSKDFGSLRIFVTKSSALKKQTKIDFYKNWRCIIDSSFSDVFISIFP